MEQSALVLAVPMMAGPQILSSIIFVTGKNPVRISVAYVAAVAPAATVGIFAATVIAGRRGNSVSLGDDSGPTAAAQAIQTGLVGLLIFMSIKSYLGRK